MQHQKISGGEGAADTQLRDRFLDGIESRHAGTCIRRGVMGEDATGVGESGHVSRRARPAQKLSILNVHDLAHEFGLCIASEIGPVGNALVADTDMRGELYSGIGDLRRV